MEYKEIEMMKGAKILVDICAEVKHGEKVLIVTDTESIQIAKIIAAVAFERGAEVVICIMTTRSAHGENPPEIIVSAMMNANVIFEPTKYSLTRADATKKASKAGARIVSMPCYDNDVLIGGGIEADFLGQEKMVDKMANLFTKAITAKLTAPSGTNLVMQLGERKGDVGKGFCRKPGEICGPPNIEANISPMEGTAEGIIVCDVSVPHPEIGLVTPIKLTVKNGLITNIEGQEKASTLRSVLEKAKDKNVYNIAELGIGLNPKAKIRGIMVEDEGAMGTAHIGIGDNHTSGGKVTAPLHLDLVIKNPTLELDEKVVIKNSKFLF